MGLFGFGKKKPEEKTQEELILQGAFNKGIIVPNHAKPVVVIPEKKVVVSKKNIFVINGVYDIGTQVMLSGVVESGKLSKKLITKINDKNVPISDVKIGSESVKELLVGSSGTIFLRGNNIPLLRSGDLLEFKEKK